VTLLLNRQSYTKRRYSGGSRNADGEWTDSVAAEASEGSLQPVDGDELQTLEFGARQSDTRVYYTDDDDWRTTEQVGTKERADELVADGDTWQARQIEAWDGLLPHYKVYLTRLKE